MTRGMMYVCVAVGALVWVQSADAFSNYLDAWKLKYPTSTLPERMMATVDGMVECHVCHHPPSRSDLGNCYRMDLKALLDADPLLSIEDALDMVDGMDSDGDGVPNGVEATTPREDQPGQVGYNMGLVGPTGTDPCSPDFNPVSNELETPPVPVPAVSEWGLLALSLVVLVAGTMLIRLRFRPVRAIVRR